MFHPSRLIFAASLFAAAPAMAADPQGDFAVHGAGSQSCQQYLSAVEGGSSNQQLLIYVSWAQGYISSLNRNLQDVFDALPTSNANDIATLLSRVCRDRPDSAFESAVRGLVNAFAPMRLGANSPVIELTRGEQTVRVRKAALAQVQQYLKDSGRYDGGVDGVFGERTAEAISGFQAEANIPQTGLPDLNTFAAILARIVQSQQGSN